MKKTFNLIIGWAKGSAVFLLLTVFNPGYAWAGLGFTDFPVLNTLMGKIVLGAVILGECGCAVYLVWHFFNYNKEDDQAGGKILKCFIAMVGIALTATIANYLYNLAISSGATSPMNVWTQPAQ